MPNIQSSIRIDYDKQKQSDCPAVNSQVSLKFNVKERSNTGDHEIDVENIYEWGVVVMTWIIRIFR